MKPLIIFLGCWMLMRAAMADSLVTLLITVTNAPAPGSSLTVNGVTRTWTNSVGTPATQIRTSTNGPAAAATNLYSHLASYPFAGPLALGMTSSNTVSLRGQLNQSIAASSLTNWATLTLSTNANVTNMVTVRVPAAAEAQNVRRYVADELVRTLRDNAQSNAFDAATPALAEFVSRSATQTITGPKTFTGATVLLSVTTSNGVNKGSAFSSPGAGGESEQFGALATASAAASTAVGASAAATGVSGTAVGAYATAAGQRSIVIGEGATDNGYSNTVVLGKGAAATGAWDIILGAINHIVRVPGMILGPVISNAVYHGTIGNLSGGTITGSTITGSVVHATGGLLNGVTVSNGMIYASGGQVLGAVLSNVVVYSTGGLQTGGKTVSQEVTNATIGTPTLVGESTVNGTLKWAMTSSSALANGVNAGVDPGPGAFLKLASGPTAAFTINGIASGSAGRVLAIHNATGYPVTWANESGIDPVAGNRIRTYSGGDLTGTGNSLMFLIYDGTISRWVLLGQGSTTNASGVSSFNGSTGAVTGVASYNGSTGAVTGPGLSADNAWPGSNAFSGPLRSPGTGSNSEKLGSGAIASGDSSVALGWLAKATNSGAVALGQLSTASGDSAIAVRGTASGQSAVAIGYTSFASAAHSTAIGDQSDSQYASSTALGYLATANAANQVRLGTSSEHVSIPGRLALEKVLDLSYLAPSGSPSANTGRLGVHKNGSKFVLVVVWPDGSTNAIAQQP